MAAAYLLEDNEIVGWAGPGLTGSWAGHGAVVTVSRRAGGRAVGSQWAE